jgi:hypothetical protein
MLHLGCCHQHTTSLIVSFVTEDSEPGSADQTRPAPEESSVADESDAMSHAQQAEPIEHMEQPEDQLRQRPKHWWQRPTVGALKREQEKHRDYMDQQDEKGNARTRLPVDESVHLGGLVLAEAFSPSTVSVLYSVLRSWPGNNDRRRDEWTADLDRSRSGRHSGWGNLGVVRPPGEFMVGDGYHDSKLPDSVTAVWLHLNFLMPSVAVVVATFTFRDEVADVSALLRADYQTQIRDVRILVYGKFGWLRARLPWSRSKSHGMTASMSTAEDENAVHLSRSYVSVRQSVVDGSRRDFAGGSRWQIPPPGLLSDSFSQSKKSHSRNGATGSAQSESTGPQPFIVP